MCSTALKIRLDDEDESLVEVALLGWIPASIILFACLPPLRALVLTYVGAWLMLPMAKISIQGFWDLDKVVAANVGALLGAVLFATHTLRGFRIQTGDVLVVAFCGCGLLSSVDNGRGFYDGVSAFSQELFYFGIPFLLGRIIVKGRGEFLEASRMMVFAAAVYAVFALWEWRMSPQIHQTLYGVFQHQFIQHYRWGFYRPILCFPHALSLGMFMAWASVLAFWLYRSRQLGPMLGIPAEVFVALPIAGLLASMSLSPWGLAIIALAMLYSWQRSRNRIWLYGPVLFVTIWMAGRFTGATDGRWLTALAANVSTERADSLQYRIDAESLILDNVKKQPILGFGRGKQQTGQEENTRPLANDGLWVIMVGRYGLVGLGLFFAWWCWPLMMARSASRELEANPAIMVQLVGIGIEAMNFMFNGVTSPLVTLMCGGVVSSLLVLQRRRTTGGAYRSGLHQQRGAMMLVE